MKTFNRIALAGAGQNHVAPFCATSDVSLKF